MIFSSGNKISLIIIWQSQSQANPCALIGSFLVGHRRFCQPTGKCKHKKKTATDMNTLLRYMEANGMKNELEHLFLEFFFFFFNARRKNREGCEPATVSSFQPSIQRYLTYSRTMSSKNPETSLQRSQIPLFTSTVKETWRTASC